MDSVLGRKQRIKNSDWIETFDKIEQLITKEELDQLVNKTIQDIKAKTKGKQAAYAWSGGKDSLVLGEICRRAGISSCVLVISNLEYKAFTQWVEDNKPPELTIINTGQDLKWLVAHPHMLFPQDSKSRRLGGEEMQDNEKESRADGYKNLMNKYGTQDDVSEQYRFESDDPVTDVELTLNYEENGLFAKIIDIPCKIDKCLYDH